MNVTFLIGNGFDLAAGLRTSYSDFYTWYMLQPSATSDILKLKEEIYRWTDLELELGKLTNNVHIDDENDIKKFCQQYEDLHKHLAKFMVINEEKYSVDLIDDDAVCDFGQSIADFYQRLESTNEQYKFDLLMKDCNKQEVSFKFISFNYTNLLDRYIAALTARENELKAKKYSNCITVDPQVLHIHGTAEYRLILGVEEEELVANRDVLQIPEIRDTLIKKNSDEVIGKSWYKKAYNQIDRSDLICVFGMSLGDSDSLWWRKIVFWLRNNPRHRIIVFWHEKDAIDKDENFPDQASIMDPVSINEKVKQILMKYCVTSPKKTKEDMKARIHIVVNDQHILKIPQVKISIDEYKQRSFTTY